MQLVFLAQQAAQRHFRRTAMRAASRSDRRIGQGTRGNALPFGIALHLPPSAVSARGDEQFFRDRRQHHAQHRLAVFDQSDVDGEFAVALDEFARAIQRIDQPVTRPFAPLFPWQLACFFGNDRQQRIDLRQPGGDDFLCGQIRRRERRQIAFHFDVEVFAIDDHDGIAGKARQHADFKQQGMIGHGAHRRPARYSRARNSAAMERPSVTSSRETRV